jgi:hypothetical protein
MLPAEVIKELEAIKLDPVALGKMFELEEQTDCPVTHHFGPGIYIRSVQIKAGDFIVGHKHKTSHTVMALGGQVVAFTDDGIKQVNASQAPVIFTAGPGHKSAQCLADCCWVNIFPNPDDCRDIETLEARYLDKESAETAIDPRLDDRDDFRDAVVQFGMTEDQVKAMSDRDELVPIPDAYTWRLSIRPSSIEGKGLFLSVRAKKGEVIAPATVSRVRSEAGKFVNHSKSPNCEYKHFNGETWLVAVRDIDGAKGGSPGEELTVDYRQAVALSLEVSK